MALQDRVPEKSAPRTGTPCSIGDVYLDVADNPAELRELNKILYEEGNTQREVYDYLTKAGGYVIGGQTPNRHRGKDCRCFKQAPFRFCHECRYDKPSCICGAA